MLYKMRRKALLWICASATKVLAGSSQSWIFSSFVCPARLAEAAEKYGAAPASPAPALQTSQLPRAVQGPQNSLVRQCFSRQPSASPGSHVRPPPQAKRRLPRPRLLHRRDGGPRGPHIQRRHVRRGSSGQAPGAALVVDSIHVGGLARWCLVRRGREARRRREARGVDASLLAARERACRDFTALKLGRPSYCSRARRMACTSTRRTGRRRRRLRQSKR